MAVCRDARPGSYVAHVTAGLGRSEVFDSEAQFPIARASRSWTLLARIIKGGPRISNVYYVRVSTILNPHRTRPLRGPCPRARRASEPVRIRSMMVDAQLVSIETANSLQTTLWRPRHEHRTCSRSRVTTWTHETRLCRRHRRTSHHTSHVRNSCWLLHAAGVSRQD